MAEWQNRPLDAVYPVVFIDAIHVKIRDGAVANRPVYVALAVTVEGRREILGLWADYGGEGTRHRLHILTEIKNRGVSDVLILVCDGLKGLPDAVETVWPRTIVQTCPVHLLRNSFRYAARRDWDKIAKVLKPVYTAATEDAALERLAEFADAWGRKYPAIVKLWENAWEEFTPFLRFDTEIRRIVCTTNAIASVNARIRRAVKSRGHSPKEQAALKRVYMAITSLDPTGRGQARWTLRWKRPERLRHHLRRTTLRSPPIILNTLVTLFDWPCLAFGGDGACCYPRWMRWRRRLKPARPCIWRAIRLVLVLTPSVGPLLCGSVSPAITASMSRSRPRVKACRWGRSAVRTWAIQCVSAWALWVCGVRSGANSLMSEASWVISGQAAVSLARSLCC